MKIVYYIIYGRKYFTERVSKVGLLRRIDQMIDKYSRQGTGFLFLSDYELTNNILPIRPIIIIIIIR